jgi:DNA primase
VAEFYSAGSGTIPPLPGQTFPPPFSEGYWSVFRLHALGVPVAALMGSSVSEEQLALLRDRGTRRLTLLWDGDDAGRKARERALPDLASAFFVRAPVLPDGEKPDTLPERALRALVDLA